MWRCEPPLGRPFLPRTRQPCQTHGRHGRLASPGAAADHGRPTLASARWVGLPLGTRPSVSYNAIVRYVRQAGTDPSFLVKALGEAAGELRRSLEGLPRRALLA